ncbi:5-guanidino-2-oxopentanoate decarboxylase [Steroidobacter cummioxidans]|uniref:5-guanidino-2-oxopentanoate decarboxylase n=1 Tax=Steroidobacter cummioxidans TaxID=1803913 RepID=UPI000E318CB3|nr:5-guanidino-2-oxopentanoate decarboxylase [Steroidobacter cummioxidans]
MLTCGELLVQLLESYGVEVVFGIPGVHTVELYRGLPATRIRHITPRHEQGAGFMADGYARASGKPGVCFIITGPGMTNIMTAMGQAYADSIPMLVISSVNRVAELGMGGGRLHELPSQRQVIAGASAFSHTLMRPDELPAVLSRAFAIFASGRPRPVHIEIPIDVITANAEHVNRKLGAPPSRPAPCPDAIARAAKMLKTAKRPVVLLGGGSCDASAEATALVEALDAPVANTINAKGVLPKNHPLSVGSNQSLVPVRELVLDADVVLAIGTELGETDYDVVFDGQFRIGGALIRVDIDPAQLHSNFIADLAILSDAKLAIRSLLQHLGAPKSIGADSPGSTRAAKVRRELAQQWPETWRGQRRTLETVQEVLPNVLIAGDSTQPVYSGNHLYEPTQPRSWFNSSTGYGTLGYGLPAAIGAKLAAPTRPVVALIGDGGLQFTFAELASAVEAEAGIVVLLWNNHGYGEIKRYMDRRDIPQIGVDIFTPDFLAASRALGCDAERATSFEHLSELLQRGARAKKPLVIELMESADFMNTEN